MTVQELIDELNAVKDKSLTIVVPDGYRTVNTDCWIGVKDDFEYRDRSGWLHKAVKISIDLD